MKQPGFLSHAKSFSGRHLASASFLSMVGYHDYRYMNNAFVRKGEGMVEYTGLDVVSVRKAGEVIKNIHDALDYAVREIDVCFAIPTDPSDTFEDHVLSIISGSQDFLFDSIAFSELSGKAAEVFDELIFEDKQIVDLLPDLDDDTMPRSEFASAICDVYDMLYNGPIELWGKLPADNRQASQDALLDVRNAFTEMDKSVSDKYDKWIAD